MESRESFGRMPIKMDIDVLEADNPKNLKLGWIVKMHPVTIMIGFGSSSYCRECGKKWPVTKMSWDQLSERADKHLKTRRHRIGRLFHKEK